MQKFRQNTFGRNEKAVFDKKGSKYLWAMTITSLSFDLGPQGQFLLLFAQNKAKDIKGRVRLPPSCYLGTVTQIYTVQKFIFANFSEI